MGLKIRIKVENGRISEGRDVMHAILKHIGNADLIVDFLDVSAIPTTVEEWRKLYFALRDVLHESVDTGYTKTELHDVVKHKIMQDMINSGIHEYFIYGQFPASASTKHLTTIGWKEYLKRFKEFAMETFEIYL